MGINFNISLKRSAYIIGAFAPALILGLVPLILGLSLGSILIYFFGYVFLLGAIGDFIIIYFILKYTVQKSKILDHPTKIGFLIVSCHQEP
ncbi:metalloprotease family protein [Sphingobacterium thalpophilum]|uniref:metalloprotease family protein n=1 Tax=Sphingobacterium thalpophilum TaxID=259 RepID=UPI003981BE0D